MSYTQSFSIQPKFIEGDAYVKVSDVARLVRTGRREYLLEKAFPMLEQAAYDGEFARLSRRVEEVETPTPTTGRWSRLFKRR